jgi:hypothetical protein
MARQSAQLATLRIAIVAAMSRLDADVDSFLNDCYAANGFEEVPPN